MLEAFTQRLVSVARRVMTHCVFPPEYEEMRAHHILAMENAFYE